MALNPIAFTERVVDDFLHYQLTTYPLADPDLPDRHAGGALGACVARGLLGAR